MFITDDDKLAGQLKTEQHDCDILGCTSDDKATIDWISQ